MYMKKYFTINKLTIIFAALSWFVPFFVSIFLIDPETKMPIIDPILFKVIMVVILAAITFYAYNKIKAKIGMYIQTANTFLAVNIVLDMAILVGLLGVPFVTWIATVLPVYILVFYGMYFIIKRHGIQ
jgi:hypothetical protein